MAAGGSVLFRGAELLPYLEPARQAGVRQAAAELPRSGPGGAERLVAFENDVLLPGLLLVEDATFAAFGIEGRVPLVDPVVARVLRAIPLAEKSPEDAPRRLFRAAFAGRLPEAAARRTDKMGFPVPLAAWLDGPLRFLRHEHPGLARLGEIGFRPEILPALRRGALGARTQAFVVAVAEALHQHRRGQVEASA
jgi:hypothetical protein